MQLLLDTHAFIWFVENDPQFPKSIIPQIENVENEIFLSIASIWEIGIKMSLNKLKVNHTIEKIIDLAVKNGFQLLPILPQHIVQVTSLEFYHRDPFDRLIIAQALCENQLVVGLDEVFDLYGVKRLWE